MRAQLRELVLERARRALQRLSVEPALERGGVCVGQGALEHGDLRIDRGPLLPLYRDLAPPETELISRQIVTRT
jgi:hypothetical protein